MDEMLESGVRVASWQTVETHLRVDVSLWTPQSYCVPVSCPPPSSKVHFQKTHLHKTGLSEGAYAYHFCARGLRGGAEWIGWGVGQFNLSQRKLFESISCGESPNYLQNFTQHAVGMLNREAARTSKRSLHSESKEVVWSPSSTTWASYTNSLSFNSLFFKMIKIKELCSPNRVMVKNKRNND